jgi:hypothetical protein
MRLHILTACSRPDLLPAVAASIETAAFRPWELCWHIRFDTRQQHVGGQQLKNDMLDQITDGWVCFIDDDTIMHPGLLVPVADVLERGLDGIVVAQTRADGRLLRADPANVRVGEIDIGQVVLSRELIGDTRIPISYEGDGQFLAAVLPDARVAYLDVVLSYHNQLTRVAI